MQIRIFTILVVALVFAACGKKPATEAELAQAHFLAAEQYFADNKLNAAKFELDTIKSLYPKQVAVRRRADSLFIKIQLIELKRNLVYADSLLRVKQPSLDSAARNFVFEKNESYEDLGNYVYKALRTEVKAGSTYIKPLVDENGNFLLTSVLYGGAIGHYQARFSVGSLFAETDKVTPDMGYSHSFVDNGSTIETVIYKGDSNKEIAAFVQQNADKAILVTLTGAKGKRSYTLSAAERKAISESYNLSVIVSDVRNLERIVETSKKKIILYENEI
ncbi:MAG: hypothetical protein LBR81_07855 [Prevotellaceae bacterium]|jgi:hypothetical protein|nr:hypothetical protein [Prevotellaceae bacterium]